MSISLAVRDGPFEAPAGSYTLVLPRGARDALRVTGVPGTLGGLHLRQGALVVKRR